MNAFLAYNTGELFSCSCILAAPHVTKCTAAQTASKHSCQNVSINARAGISILKLRTKAQTCAKYVYLPYSSIFTVASISIHLTHMILNTYMYQWTK